MDTDRNGMLAKTGTYDHMLLSFFKFPTTEWWKEQVLRTGEIMGFDPDAKLLRDNALKESVSIPRKNKYFHIWDYVPVIHEIPVGKVYRSSLPLLSDSKPVNSVCDNIRLEVQVHEIQKSFPFN